MPAETPETMPEVGATVAIPVDPEVHVPPVVELLNVVVAPAQTADVPFITPPFGNGLTVIVLVAVALPQMLVTVYEIIAVPAATPVVIPVEPTVAIPVALELHTPPVVELLSVMVEPAQTADAPVIVPAVGAVITLTDLVATPIPQLVVTL